MAQEPEHKPRWSYEGAEGPAYWGDLSEDYALCRDGERQSPINIRQVSVTNVPDLAFDYAASALNILNNGYTLQVDYDAGSRITFNGVTYHLLQFHFHLPSEHKVDGQLFDMELHLVHRDADGNLAVVGVLLTEGDEDNAAYAPIWEHAPADTMEEAETVEGVSIHAADLLPDTFSVFAYNGSLTTPPCSEGVQWLILTTPVALSAAQIKVFALNFFEGTNRPVQPLNGREVALDFFSD